MGGFPPDIRRGFEESKRDIRSTIKKRDLRSFIKKIQGEIADLRRKYGLKVPNSQLVGVLELSEKAPEGNKLLVPKHVLDKMFSRYGLTMPDYNTYPAHAWISFPRTVYGRTEVVTIEVVMYETMCALFTLYRERLTVIQRRDSTKKEVKTSAALHRAAVSAAFYFLESYLNGIAFEYYVAHKESLDEKTRAILTEWDFTGGRTKYVNLRDKLLQYPRIICGVPHPPLQESNCDPLRYTLDKAKTLRDAIVHAAPMPLDGGTHDAKEIEILRGTEPQMLEEVVDNIIKLVRVIETTIRGDDKHLHWLLPRGSDGLFPEETFS